VGFILKKRFDWEKGSGKVRARDCDVAVVGDVLASSVNKPGEALSAAVLGDWDKYQVAVAAEDSAYGVGCVVVVDHWLLGVTLRHVKT
jgi:hypothetical protein